MLALLLGLALVTLALGISHQLTLSWARSGEAITKVVTVTASGETNRDITVNANTTDMRVDIDMDADKIQSVYILSDQDLTIETNAVDATGGNTINLTAGKPYIWYAGCGWANKITLDVASSMYLTNGTASAALVQIRILEDVTS